MHTDDEITDNGNEIDKLYANFFASGYFDTHLTIPKLNYEYVVEINNVVITERLD